MIPLSQAAYIKGRITTEHAFAMKILCEKSMTSCDHSTHILLLDMTKAFDAINREYLYKYNGCMPFISHNEYNRSNIDI